MPKLTKGMNVRASLYDHRAGLAKANRRIRNTRNWYNSVRQDYATQR